MDIELLLKFIEFSVFYLVEEIHLSLLIKLLIDKGYASDIFDLIIKISSKFKTCRNFNYQNYNLEELLKKQSRKEPFNKDIIHDDYYLKDQNSSSNNSNNSILSNSVFSFGLSDKKENSNNNTKNSTMNQNTIEIQKFSSNSPNTNSAPDINIKKNKNPTFEFSFQIMRGNNTTTITPLSVFSEVFNTPHRSWSIKIDINSNGEVSFYLIERGPSPSSCNYNMLYSLNYTSILCDFTIRDISFEKNGVLFFSFSNDQNQIIGYDNFFNLKQLGKKDTLNFVLWIKEYPLHSACIQHISDNFQPLFLNKKGKKDPKEIILNTNSKNEKAKSYLDLDPFDIASILFNDNLRVDNENTVISALYMYCLNKEPNIIDQVMGAVRYEFVDFKIMCTLARDHDVIKQAPMFKIGFSRELNNRINKLNNSNDSNENRGLVKKKIGIKRKYYTLSQSDLSLNISNELISFFLEKNHHSGYIEKLNKLQLYIEEEKKEHEKREEILQRQNRELKIEIQRLNEIEEKKKKYFELNKIRKPENKNNLQTFLSNVCTFFQK